MNPKPEREQRTPLFPKSHLPVFSLLFAFGENDLAACGKTWKLKFFSLLRVIGFGVFEIIRGAFLVV
jgi:hypothetical protein